MDMELLTAALFDEEAYVVPRDLDAVFKDECVCTCADQESVEGVFVSLKTHEAYSIDKAREFYAQTNAPFFVNFKKRLVKLTEEEKAAREAEVRQWFEATGQIKLDAAAPTYTETHTLVFAHWNEGTVAFEPVPEEVLAIAPQVAEIVQRLVEVPSAEVRDHAAAYQSELTTHPDIENMVQEGEPGSINIPTMMAAPGGLKCQHPDCDITSGLWLFLQDGYVGCSRQQYGSSDPGRGHAMQHWTDTGKSVAVKLGTISPEGRADVHVYTDDDEHYDPQLGKHLAHFGIDLASATKTERSMAEMELDWTLAYEQNVISEGGKELVRVGGPGLTGLRNIGNSCYIASVLQTLFSLPAFQERYFGRRVDAHNGGPVVEPAVNNPFAFGGARAPRSLECQLRRIAEGLLSGHYIWSEDRLSITPRLLKKVIGANHPEFNGPHQQDAFEFMQYLLQQIERADRKHEKKVADVFRFTMQQRIQCVTTLRTRYSTNEQTSLTLPIPVESEPPPPGEERQPPRVSIEDCVRACFEDAMVQATIGRDERTTATSQTRFKTFPDFLVFQMGRFTFRNMQVGKNDAVVDVGNGLLDMTPYLAAPPGADEVPLPDEPGAAAGGAAGGAAAPHVDQAIVDALMATGFGLNPSRRAAHETGNSGADAALMWLLDHSGDADIETPLEQLVGGGGDAGGAGAAAGPPPPPQELVEMVCMVGGFTPQQAAYGLRQTNNDAERAIDYLFNHPEVTGEEDRQPEAGGDAEAAPVPDFTVHRDGPGTYRLKAFITHLGRTPGSGHYVAHVRHDREGWVFYNDERVLRSEDAPSGLAYVYVYERVHQ